MVLGFPKPSVWVELGAAAWRAVGWGAGGAEATSGLDTRWDSGAAGGVMGRRTGAGAAVDAVAASSPVAEPAGAAGAAIGAAWA